MIASRLERVSFVDAKALVLLAGDLGAGLMVTVRRGGCAQPEGRKQAFNVRVPPNAAFVSAGRATRMYGAVTA